MPGGLRAFWPDQAPALSLDITAGAVGRGGAKGAKSGFGFFCPPSPSLRLLGQVGCGWFGVGWIELLDGLDAGKAEAKQAAASSCPVGRVAEKNPRLEPSSCDQAPPSLEAAEKILAASGSIALAGSGHRGWRRCRRTPTHARAVRRPQAADQTA